MNANGLDPRQLTSVLDNKSPVTAASVITMGELLVKQFPEGVTLASLVPAVQLILRMSKTKMSMEAKRQFCIDILRYTVDNTDSGPTLEKLDDVIKDLIPTAVDVLLQQQGNCLSCFKAN